MTEVPLLVLAGGFGTRLRSAIGDFPKPLANVNSKPFLYYLIENWYNQGVRNFVLLLHYKPDLFLNLIKNLRSNPKFSNATFKSVIEDEPLGTAGSIKNALSKFEHFDQFLVSNADTWLGSGIEEMIASGPSSIAAVKLTDCSRYGTLEFCDNTITNFIEKQAAAKNKYINAGTYYFSREVFSLFSTKKTMSLEMAILPEMARNKSLKIVKIKTTFSDIGIPEDYYDFCRWINYNET